MIHVCRDGLGEVIKKIGQAYQKVPPLTIHQFRTYKCMYKCRLSAAFMKTHSKSTQILSKVVSMSR